MFILRHRTRIFAQQWGVIEAVSITYALWRSHMYFFFFFLANKADWKKWLTFVLHFCRRRTRWLRSTAVMDPRWMVASHHEIIFILQIFSAFNRQKNEDILLVTSTTVDCSGSESAAPSLSFTMRLFVFCLVFCPRNISLISSHRMDRNTCKYTMFWSLFS